MALYIPDLKLQEATEVVKNLSDEGRDGLIKYFIEHQEKAYKKSQKANEEYQKVFDGMSRFIPRNGKSTVYG